MSASTHTSRRLTALVAIAVTAMVALLAWTATRSGSEAAPAPARANAAQAGKLVLASLPGDVKASLAIRSFDAGGTNAGTTTGGGGGSGKFVPDDVALVLDAAEVDPLLLRAVATGVHLQKATVTVFRAGTNDRQQVWDFADVTLSEMRTAQTGSAKPPRVSLGLRYATVTLTTYDASGAAVRSFCFSVATGAGC